METCWKISSKLFFGNDSVVEAAVPVSAFTLQDIGQTGLTAEVASQLLLKSDIIKQYNFFEAPKLAEVKPVEAGGKQVTPKEAKKTRLFIMIGVFAVLVVVLLFVIIQSGNQPTPRKKSARVTPTITLPEQPTPLAQGTQTDVASSSASFSQSTKVEIQRSAAQSSHADALQSDLEGLGIRQITSEESFTASDSGTVSFSSAIPQNARDTILGVVKKYIAAPIVRDNNEMLFDIRISF